MHPEYGESPTHSRGSPHLCGNAPENLLTNPPRIWFPHPRGDPPFPLTEQALVVLFPPTKGCTTPRGPTPVTRTSPLTHQMVQLPHTRGNPPMMARSSARRRHFPTPEGNNHVQTAVPDRCHPGTPTEAPKPPPHPTRNHVTSPPRKESRMPRTRRAPPLPAGRPTTRPSNHARTTKLHSPTTDGDANSTSTQEHPKSNPN